MYKTIGKIFDRDLILEEVIESNDLSKVCIKDIVDYTLSLIEKSEVTEYQESTLLYGDIYIGGSFELFSIDDFINEKKESVSNLAGDDLNEELANVESMIEKLSILRDEIKKGAI